MPGSRSLRFPDLYFAVLAGMIVFLYFELPTQVWFLNLTGGYLIRIWIPPFVLCCGLVIRKVWRKERLIEWNVLNAALLLYVAFALVAMMVNESPYLAGKYYLIMTAPVWAYAVIVDGIRDRKDVERIFRILFYCVLAVVTYHFFLQVPSLRLPEFLTRDVVTHLGDHMALGGAVYKIYDPSGGPGIEYFRGLWSYEYGKYAALLSPIILFSLYRYIQCNNWRRFLYLAIVALMVYQIIYTLSRAGLASLMAGTAVLLTCIFIAERKSRGRILFLAVFLILETVLVVLQDKPFLLMRYLQPLNIIGDERINQFLISSGVHWKGSLAVVDPHLKAAASSLKAFSASPLLGAGYSMIHFEILELNRFIFVLSSAGLLTFLPYLTAFVSVIVLSLRGMMQFRRSGGRGMNYGYLFFALSFVFVIKLFIYEGLESYYYWIIFALATAWVNSFEEERRKVLV